MEDTNKEMEFDFNDIMIPEAGMTKTSGSNSKTREGRVLTLTGGKSLGTYLVKPLITLKEKDSTPLIVRKVMNGYEGSCLGFKYQVPSIHSFQEFGTSLSDAEYALLSEVRTKLYQLSGPTSFMNLKKNPWLNDWITLSNPYQSVFMHAKLIKYLGQSSNITSDQLNKVRLLKFTKGEVGKSDFLTIFNKGVNTRTSALGSKEWLSEVFSRKEGQHKKGMSIDISRSDSAVSTYVILISYEDIPCEITQSDLENASNIYTKVYKVSEFDKKYYEELNEKLTKTIEECKKQSVELKEIKKKD